MLFLFFCINHLGLIAQPAPSNTRFVNPTLTSGTFTKSYVKHLNSAQDEMFFATTTSVNTEYFGTTLVSPMNESRMITRLDIAGLPIWNAKFYPESITEESNVSKDYSCVDIFDNFYTVCNTRNTSATFVDALGATENFSNPSATLKKIIVKLDKNGNKIWSKQFNNPNGITYGVALTSDSNGDLYIVGTSNTAGSGLQFESVAITGSFIFKISGTTGTILYSSIYPNYGCYQFIPVLDDLNNLYVFTEPLATGSNYVFNSITIPTNTDHADNLMLKFDATGNCVFGKNFYTSNPAGDYSYSWINDAVFDGTNFILLGNYYSNKTLPYLLLSGVTYPKHYANTTYVGFLAKVSTSGNVVWEKPLESVNSGGGVYTNFEIDSDKNIYGYFNFKDKVFYEGNEYTFDATLGDKTISKFDNNGNLLYFKAVDKGVTQTQLIDVFANDKFNVLGQTNESLFNSTYPITNTAPIKSYVATFGNLNGSYLRAVIGYTNLSTTNISNNNDSSNQIIFNLLNDVDWTATSDQSWLTFSQINLTQKTTQLKSTISNRGDTQVILNALTNNTGLTRTANVLIKGTGVSPITITISQSGTLGINESKTLVMMLYPNPTSDFLNIQTDQEISNIEIYDLSGKLLKSTEKPGNQISVSDLSKNMYIIKIHTENGIINSKFSKN